MINFDLTMIVLFVCVFVIIMLIGFLFEGIGTKYSDTLIPLLITSISIFLIIEVICMLCGIDFFLV